MDTSSIIHIAQKYIRIIDPTIPFQKAYLFGSHAEGTAHETSDIDIAIFVNDIRDEYLKELRLLYRLRRDIDVRIEPHLFIEGRDPSGFCEEILKKGIKIQ